MYEVLCFMYGEQRRVDQEPCLVYGEERCVDQVPRFMDEASRFVDQTPLFMDQTSRFVHQKQRQADRRSRGVEEPRCLMDQITRRLPIGWVVLDPPKRSRQSTAGWHTTHPTPRIVVAPGATGLLAARAAGRGRIVIANIPSPSVITASRVPAPSRAFTTPRSRHGHPATSCAHRFLTGAALTEPGAALAKRENSPTSARPGVSKRV